MLIRQDPDGAIVITQPAHAWLSGQIARAWGNREFGQVAPYEDVCVAAAQHDIGWITWEQAPTLNRSTGMPHTFLELPVGTHVAIWETASRRALALGRYPALLTSMHFTGLYAQRDFSGVDQQEARAARDLISRELAFQAKLVDSLRADPRMAPHATADVLERNRRLNAVWDAMSLAICGGLTSARTFSRVPAGAGEVELTLTPGDGWLTVEPWPFKRDTVELRVEGRRLRGSFTDERDMRAALEDAPWLTIVTILSPV